MYMCPCIICRASSRSDTLCLETHLQGKSGFHEKKFRYKYFVHCGKSDRDSYEFLEDAPGIIDRYATEDGFIEEG